MSRRAWGCVLLITVLCWSEPGAAGVPAGLMGRVEILCAAELAGRGAGSAEGLVAGDSLALWLGEAGLDPLFTDGWYQPFRLHGKGWTGQDLEGRGGRNVGGKLPGRGRLAGRWVLVCAHFDHLGRVGPDPAQGYYAGANDNASGVTVLVEVASRLAAASWDETDRRGLLVVGFDGEEVGLQGSEAMLAAMPVPLDSLDAVINMDTVGQALQGRLHVSGLATCDLFPDIITAAESAEMPLARAPVGWSGSDHMTFARKHVPALFLFGGPYPQYNTPGDLPETLDPDVLAAVAGFATRVTTALLFEPRNLVWNESAPDPARSDEGPGGAYRNAWLGTMPDFTAGIEGYLIGAVFDGSPAATAGLAKGDVLVRMAGLDVTDLKTFTTALRTYPPGTPVEISVRREGRLLNFTVVLGDRAERH